MGIFGISRGRVKELRRKETLEALKRGKEERELRRKTEKAKAESAYYKVKAESKKRKKEASFQWTALPRARVKVGKKKQGRRLSSKSRIRLI